MVEGFLIGVLVGGWYAYWFIKTMKKNGYVNFDITDKFKDEKRNH